MPFEQAIPNISPKGDVLAFWPDENISVSTGGAWRPQGTITGKVRGTSVNLFTGAAGFVTMQMEDEIYCGRLDGSFGPSRISFTGFPSYTKETSANLAAGLITSELLRVYWLRTMWKMDMAINPTDETGICFLTGSGGTIDAWPTAGTVAFGMVGDGAGDMTVRAYSNGAFPGNILWSVPFPAGLNYTQWHMLEMQMIGASPTRQGSVEFLVDGASIVKRDWTNAPLLPTKASAAVNATNWAIQARSENLLISHVGPTFAQLGRFTRSGLEIAD